MPGIGHDEGFVEKSIRLTDASGDGIFSIVLGLSLSLDSEAASAVRVDESASALNFILSREAIDLTAGGIGTVIETCPYDEEAILVSSRFPLRVEYALLAMQEEARVEFYYAYPGTLSPVSYATANPADLGAKSFVARTFAIKARLSDEKRHILKPADILSVRGVPEADTVRLTLCQEEVGFNDTFARPSSETDSGACSLGAPFSASIQRLFDEVFLKGGGIKKKGESRSVQAELRFESNSPLTIAFRRFNLSYSLLARPKPGGTDKKTLCFDKNVHAHSIRFSLPPASQYIAVDLRLGENVQPFSLIKDDLAVLSTSPPSDRGVRLEDGSWVAVRRDATKRSFTALAFGILAFTSPAIIGVSIRRDAGGAPLGEELFQGKLNVDIQGTCLWRIVYLPPSLGLAASPWWILLKSIQGSTIWLTTPSEGSSVLAGAGKAEFAEGMSRVERVLPLYRMIARATGEMSSSHCLLSASADGGTIGVSLKDEKPDGALCYAVGPVTAHETDRDLIVSFFCPVEGRITVYPITVEYHQKPDSMVQLVFKN